MHGNATIIEQTDPKLVYSVEQRKALELMTIVEEKCPTALRDGQDTVYSLEEKCPIAQRDGQDTVYSLEEKCPIAQRDGL